MTRKSAKLKCMKVNQRVKAILTYLKSDIGNPKKRGEHKQYELSFIFSYLIFTVS